MVNYPHKVIPKNNIKKVKKETVDFANRGMSFEKMINDTNDYYLSRGMAVIHKKPTPIQIVKVNYPRRSRAKIVVGRPPRAKREICGQRTRLGRNAAGDGQARNRRNAG